MKDETKAILKSASAAVKAGFDVEKLPVIAVSGATGHMYSRYNQALILAQLSMRDQVLPVTGRASLGDLVMNVSRCYTFNQVKQHGWRVRKGAKSLLVNYHGDDAVGLVKIDEQGQRIEKKEGADFAPAFFRVFTDNDIEKDSEAAGV